MKSLENVLKRDKEKYKVAKSVQDAIPIKNIWRDGIFCVSTDVYAKTWRFTDINYAVASREDKETMFLQYGELINSFEAEASTKITVIMRKLNRSDFKRRILLPLKSDENDKYRKELNEMLLDKAIGSSSIIAEKYITVTIGARSIEDARTAFARIGVTLSAQFTSLNSRCTEVTAVDKLRVLHDFYRNNEEDRFDFQLKEQMRLGHSFKDSVCPDSMEFQADHFRIGERYGRALFFKEWSAYIKDDMLAKVLDLGHDIMLSIDVVPVATDEAVREVERRMLGVETNIANWQRRQNKNNNYAAIVPYDMEQQRQETIEFMDDLTTRDQKMHFGMVTMVHMADSIEQLNNDTKSLNTICKLGTLRYQQMDGLNTALPIGLTRINAFRTLTTESLSALMPFRVQEVMDSGGIYIGENAISHNMIFCDKSKLLNPSSFIFGVPGSGKSFAAKMIITILALNSDDDILICDPEREYGDLIKRLGGEVINISASSPDHINAMDMVDGYGDGKDPVVAKSEFILTLFELIDTKHGVSSKQRSIIDRCLAAVYDDYKQGDDAPTLTALREKLLEQPEPEAHELALALEIFTAGTLNTFAQPTNVDTQNRMVVYDILDLGEQLKSMGLLVITDALLNRVATNWQRGRRTHLFIDEAHVVFENEHSGNFMNSAWRRFRKRNAFPTAITQNVEYILDSVVSSTMLSNSEFLIMLNQSASDRGALAELLHISDEQMKYASSAEEGQGLLKYGNSFVPFINKFPKDTELYKLMSTKANE